MSAYLASQQTYDYIASGLHDAASRHESDQHDTMRQFLDIDREATAETLEDNITSAVCKLYDLNRLALVTRYGHTWDRDDHFAPTITHDEGTVIGLAHDYASLRGDRDEFQLHLNNLLCNIFDRVFASTCTRIKFHSTTEGLDICEVEIDKSPKPIFVASIDKNSQKTEKFYVRTGNSSREFNIKEAGEYIKSRF